MTVEIQLDLNSQLVFQYFYQNIFKMEYKLLILFFLQLLFINEISAQEISYQNKELHFRENKNQWSTNIKFIGFMNAGNIFLENNKLTFQLFNGEDLKKIHPRKNEDLTIHSHVYRMNFIGANQNPEIIKENPSPEYYNYFIGNDKARWSNEVKQYQTITYLNIYPNIDFKVYGMGLTMKYEFIVHKGGNVNDIKITYEGTEGIRLSNMGSLIIKTSIGDVIEAPPFTFQNKLLHKTIINSEYVLKGNILQFKIKSNYSKNEDLIIDPTLIFSTFTGSTADNWGFTSTYDDLGNLYLGGYVNTEQFGGTYPTTVGAFQTVYGGGTGGGAGSGNGNGFSSDIGITKFNNTGTALIYSTYLGGSDNETPHSLFVNSANQLCVYGKTYSADFPVTLGCYDNSYNGDADIIVTVFNDSGTSLIGSTYIGGSAKDGVNYDPHEFIFGGLKYNYADDARGEIMCDALNNICIASSTNSTDFPVTPSAYQTANAGGQDGVVFKLSPNCSTLLSSTYLGGSLDDACFSLDKKSDNSIYITGGTMSSNFPTTVSSIHPVYIGGYSDGFVSNLSSNGVTLLSSSFIGTDSLDEIYFVRTDANDNVFLAGISEGNYPITIPSGYSGIYADTLSGQFITKINSSLDSIKFATVIGNHNGSLNISLSAFGLDLCGNIYLSGWGSSNALFGHASDITNMTVTANAFQSTTDGTDFYITELSVNAQQLVYGSYFGGSGAIEHVDGGTSRFNNDGVLYQAICAGCGGNSFTPTTTGVWSNTNNSSNCNELGMVFDIGSAFINSPTAIPLTGMAPLNVSFTSGLSSGSVHWNFGTGLIGDTSDFYNSSFIFNDTGIFTVTVLRFSQGLCASNDSFSFLIHVNDPNGTKELFALNNWSVNPNPAKNYFQILNPSNITFNYELINVIGQKIIVGNSSEGSVTVSIIELPSGIYFLEMKNEFHYSIIKLIVAD